MKPPRHREIAYRICLENDWSFAELARRMGISRQALHAMLKAQRPRRASLERLADIGRIPMIEFYSQSG